jgi:hypothetical protein
MSTQTIYITGKAKWAHLYESQMDTKFGEKFHVSIYPDEASMIALKSSGSRLQARTDEDGTFFKFSRDNKKEFKGEEEILGAPEVVVVEEGVKKPFDKIIGNGSTLTLRLSVYDSKFGKGTRLEAVRVDEHVPYINANGEEGGSNPGNYAF